MTSESSYTTGSSPLVSHVFAAVEILGDASAKVAATSPTGGDTMSKSAFGVTPADSSTEQA